METWQPEPASWLLAHARCSWMAVPVDEKALGRWGSQPAAAKTEQADLLLYTPHAWSRPLSKREAPFRGSPSAIVTQRQAVEKRGPCLLSVFTIYVLSDSKQAISCPMPQFLRLSMFTSLFWRFLLSAFSSRQA